MNPTPHEETLFQAALPLAGADRAAFLDRECAGDPALRARLEALLAAHDQPDTLFGAQADAVRPTISLDLAHDLADDLAGETIGRYKLLEKIGEGGCGVVYVAEQTEPVRRRVALKIIKLGMDTKQVVARFEAERQALAMMDHPNIAKVLDAGVVGQRSDIRGQRSEASDQRSAGGVADALTSDFRPLTSGSGRPYFVMELVRGMRITDYCDQEQLSTRDRLDLFIKVCQAIQHAHQKGIIHRDIKPSNILVTLHDGVPVPKVIDFGIAKAVEGRLTDATVYTQLHQFIGTPAYMSPEQAEMSGLDIDTRSDIYSLGVLLYELLTGVTPFDAKELMSQGIDAMRRTIREKEPPRPSTRLTQALVAVDVSPRSKPGTDAGAVSPEEVSADSRRRLRLKETIALLRGDLDWVVMKCLEKDRARRYETANGLATDLKRHLNNEPVVARPPSAAYRFQKTWRRNRLVFTAVTAMAVTLVAGLGVSMLALHQARTEGERALAAEQEQTRLLRQAEANEQKAEEEAARSRQIAQFMQNMLKGVGPSVALGRDTTMLREILDQTALRLDEWKGRPAVEADLRTTLGKVYSDLAEYTNAAAMHRQALALRKQLLGDEHPDVADSLSNLAGVLSLHGRTTEAESLYGEALAMRRELLGNDHPGVAEILIDLSLLFRNASRLVEAENAAREAVAVYRNRFGNEHLSLASALQQLAWNVKLRGRSSEAEAHAREGVAIRKKLLGSQHLDVASALFDLAVFLGDQGKRTEAEAVIQEVLAMRRTTLGSEDPFAAQSLHQLAWTLHAHGWSADAETMAREALAMRRKLLGHEHADVAATLHYLGFYLEAQGRIPEAEAAVREALTMRRKLLGNDHHDVGHSLHWLAWNLSRLGRHAEAEALASEEVALWRKLRSPEHPDVAWALAGLAVYLRNQGKLTEAEATVRESLSIRRKSLGNDHPDVVSSVSSLGDLLLRLGKPAAAEALLREELTYARALAANGTTQAYGRLGFLLHHLADVLREAKRPEQARPLAEEAVLVYERHPDLSAGEHQHAVAVLASVLTDLGDAAALESLHRRSVENLRARLPLAELQFAAALAGLTQALIAQQKFAEAEPSARESLAIREAKSPEDWRTFNSRSLLGGSLLGQKDFAEAEPLLLSAYEGLKQREDRIPPAGKPRIKETLQRLVQLYEATGQPQKAEAWSQKLTELSPAASR